MHPGRMRWTRSSAMATASGFHQFATICVPRHHLIPEAQGRGGPPCSVRRKWHQRGSGRPEYRQRGQLERGFRRDGTSRWRAASPASAPPARGETIGITISSTRSRGTPTHGAYARQVRRGTAGERLVYDAAVLAASAKQADHRAEILAPNVARSQLAAEGAPSHCPGCTAGAFLGSGGVTAEAGQSSHPPVSPDQRCMGRGRRRTAQNFTQVVRSAQHETVSACSGTELERGKESSHPHETSPSLSI